jgi:hypothetical protein
LGEAWNRGTQHYPDQPHGEARHIAARIAQVLGIPPQHPTGHTIPTPH